MVFVAAPTGLERLPVVGERRAGGWTTLMLLVVLEEGRLEGGTRTLMGGFDATVADSRPEMEGLEARDGRRMDPAGFLMLFKAAGVGLVSGRSVLESETV